MTKIIAINAIEGAKTVDGKEVNLAPGQEADVEQGAAERLVGLKAAAYVEGAPKAKAKGKSAKKAEGEGDKDEPPAVAKFIKSEEDSKKPASQGLGIL